MGDCPLWAINIMGYLINFEKYNKVFAVPSSLVEEHIKLASLLQIKVLLAVLKEGKAEEEEIAKLLGERVAEISDALDFWAERGILKGEGQPVPESEVTTGYRKITNVQSVSKPTFTDALKRAEESEEIAQMLRMAQDVLGRTISSSELSSLIFYKDHYGLPEAVIIMLLGYSKSIGKMSFRYIDKMALDWSEKGILSLESAENHIEKLRAKSEKESRIRKLLSIGDRKLSANEKKLFSRWTDEFSFGYDMISLAYDKTVDNIGKYDIRYMDKILTSWYANKIKNPRDVEQDEKAISEAKASKESSFDIDEIEKNIFKNI